MVRPFIARGTLLRDLLLPVLPAVSLLSLAMCGSSGASPSAADAGGDVTTADSPEPDGPPEAAQDSGAPADALPDGSAAVANVCDAIFGSAGRALASCCPPADLDSGAYQEGPAGEIQLGQQYCETNLGGSFSRGRIHVDGAQTSACRASVMANLAALPFCWTQATPERPDDIQIALGPAACATAVVGVQATGAPCAFDYECVAGDTCVGWTNTTDGTCQLPPQVGGICESTMGAGTVTYWYPFGPHPSCVPGADCVDTCQAQVVDGGMCDLTSDCLPGLDCVNYLCAPSYARDGGACGNYMQCQSGLWCDLGGGGPMGACRPRGAAGTPCDGTFGQCAGYCNNGSADAGTCVAICGSK